MPSPNGQTAPRRRSKPAIIMPGTEAWKQLTAAPLPPAGSTAAVKGEKIAAPKKSKPEKKAKATPKARWTPDYKDPFYSFPRRIVQMMPGDVGTVLWVLADDGTVWYRQDRKWWQLEALPRRPMKD